MSRLILPRRALLKAGAAALITSPTIIRKASAQLAGGLMFPGPGTPHSAGGGTAFKWDSAASSINNATFASLDRDFTGSTSNFCSARATIGKTTGKWYCEIVVTCPTVTPTIELGICNAGFSLATGNYLGLVDKSGGYFWANQQTIVSAAITDHATVTGTQNITSGDIIQLAGDFSSGSLWVGQNNTWKGTGANPATGTAPWLTFTAGSDTWYFAAMMSQPAGNISGGVATLSATVTFSPPSGFTTINA